MYKVTKFIILMLKSQNPKFMVLKKIGIFFLFSLEKEE